jgi:predicted nucleotide-binding protein
MKDKPKGRKQNHLGIGYTKEHVDKIVNGYNTGKPFLFCGTALRQSEIAKFSIFKFEKNSKELLLPNKKSISDEDNVVYVAECIASGKVEGAELATHEFDITPLEEESARNSKGEVRDGNEVFIVHGRDVEQALLLQNHLRDDLDIKARMFEDFKKEAGSTTIIEQLQYIWENAGYALVIATPDDCGVLHGELEKSLNTLLRGKEKVNDEEVTKLFEVLSTRARQNVVFEFGLFMGALGRNNVCCLLQESTKERPSDIEGILYTPFNKSVRETFGEIDPKLKNWLKKKT